MRLLMIALAFVAPALTYHYYPAFPELPRPCVPVNALFVVLYLNRPS